MKKIALSIIGLAGASCAFCCTIPVVGLLSMGSATAFLSGHPALTVIGALSAGLGIGVLLTKFKQKQLQACAINCACNVTES